MQPTRTCKPFPKASSYKLAIDQSIQGLEPYFYLTTPGEHVFHGWAHLSNVLFDYHAFLPGNMYYARVKYFDTYPPVVAIYLVVKSSGAGVYFANEDEYPRLERC